VTWTGWLGVDPGVWLATYASLGDEDDIEERIERAWLVRVTEPRRERIRFRESALLRFPLTMPIDICQRCLRWAGCEDCAWELDHIVELQYGGLDDPTNLVRLCVVCHRAKPHPPESTWDDPEAMRQVALAWVRKGPAGGVRPPLRSGLSPSEIAYLDAELAAAKAAGRLDTRAPGPS
jgi:hypothetical protein